MKQRAQRGWVAPWAARIALCGLLVLVGVEASATATENSLDAAARDVFLAGLEQELSELSSLQVRFRQERELALLAEPVVSEGVMAFVRPDRLHWEWTSPYPSLLVLNSGRVERFDVEQGTPRRMRAAGEEMLRSIAVQMTRWLQGRFRDSSELFAIEVMAGPPTRIVLEPKSEDLVDILTRVVVELGGRPRVQRVVLESPRGEETVLLYSDEQRNLELADELFDLSTPALIGSPPAAEE